MLLIHGPSNKTIIDKLNINPESKKFLSEGLEVYRLPK